IFDPAFGFDPALQHRKVAVARLVKTVVAVPDDGLRRVAGLDRRIILLLDGIEEAFGEGQILFVTAHSRSSSRRFAPLAFLIAGQKLSRARFSTQIFLRAA